MFHRQRLEQSLRTQRAEPADALVDDIVRIVEAATPQAGRRPVRRTLVAVALAVGMISVAAAVGAFSRSSTVASSAGHAIADVVAAPAAEADSAQPNADAVASGSTSGPAAASSSSGKPSIGPSGSASQGSASQVSVAKAAGSRTHSDLATNAPGVSRSLASISTYVIGEYICHWTFNGTGNGVYNNNRLDPSYWQSVLLTSIAVYQAHAGDVRDYGSSPTLTSAAICAASSPPA